MMNCLKHIFLVLVLAVGTTAIANSQTITVPSVGKPNTWTQAQLIEPADLVSILKDSKQKQPLIYNIGVVDDIQGARNMGKASEKANLEQLAKTLASVPKNAFVVVYCGCCPFERCPNIRPAFQQLRDMGFTNARLLNVPTNIKTDWINKGYPLAKDSK
jgi:hypothetical protein